MRNIKADVKEIVKSLKQVRKSDTRSGIAALFSGASGTGKKMAAQALATDMKTELYQVDLSSVVSKYIGETEKNLSKVFKQLRQKMRYFYSTKPMLFSANAPMLMTLMIGMIILM